MGLMASDSGGTNFEPLPAGVHHAVCYGVIDIGTQPANNPAFSDTHRCMIMWEVPEERIEIEKDGEKLNLPRVISRELTISLSEKSHMRPLLESWRGRPFNMQELMAFDLANLVGANCLLNVIHKESNGKTYANVAAAMPLPNKMEKLAPENPSIFYSMEDMGLNVPDGIPDWIVKKIHNSREWNETGQMNDWPDENPADYREPDQEDIPF